MTTHMATPADRWHSGQPTQSVSTPELATGLIVVADRRPFRIDRVRELPTDEWPQRFIAAWRQRGMPDASTWWGRPYRVSGLWEETDEDTRRHETTAPADYSWDVLPEHYAVCRLCGELPPCRHVHNEQIMARASERMAKDLAILPGACHGCREPITIRQKSFTFPGANLIRPDFGDGTAIFHTRGRCYSALASYDRRWAAAESDRTRLFYCEGTRVWHFDGTPECTRDDCTGKGDMASLVDHRCAIWHRPGTPGRLYDAMHEFGHDPGTGNDTCWCLSEKAPS